MADERRQHLYVFLASPRGVDRERGIAADVIALVNELEGESTGVHLELLGQQKVRPAAGRPQDVINPDVDRCDLFVGILWRNWGRPTGAGGHSCGFEEEFWRAHGRWKARGSPEISVYFKDLPPELVDPPNEEVREVLRFRDQVQSLVLYRSFGEGEWPNVFLKDMVDYVHGVAGGSPLARPEGAVALPSEATERMPTLEAPSTGGGKGDQVQPYPSEVTDLLRSVYEGVGTRWPDEATSDEVARLYLLAKAWFAQHRSSTVASTHEVNMYYEARQRFAPTFEEWWLLARSVMADGHDTRPGMYWLRAWSDDELPALLFDRALNDGETDVRVGALRLLGLTEYSPPDGWTDGMADDGSAQVKEGFLGLLEVRQPDWGLTIAEHLTGDRNLLVRTEAGRVHSLLLAKHEPAAALQWATSRVSAPDGPFLEKLRGKLCEVSVAELRAALGARNGETRLLAAEGLAQRGELTQTEARGLIEDKFSEVAELGLSVLLEEADQPDDEVLAVCKERGASLLGRAETAGLRRMSADGLLPLVQFYDLQGVRAYRVLAVDHFETMKERLRADLEDDFESLKAEHEGKLLHQYRVGGGDLALKVHAKMTEQMEELRKYDEFLRCQFAAAALAGLVNHGEEADVKFARRVVEGKWADGDVAREAISLLRRLGNREDAFSLVALAEGERGDLRDLAVSAAADLLARHGSRGDVDRIVSLAKADSGERQAALARAAMKLARGLAGAGGKLLETEEPALVRLALSALLGKDQGKRKRRAVGLLSSDSLGTRDAAVSFLANVCDEGELEAILEEYLKLPTYYYSVVCALDRLLYAPGVLREAFRSRIKDVVREPKVGTSGRWVPRRRG